MILAYLQEVAVAVESSDTVSRSDIDRITTMIGVVSTGIFCFFLAGLILKSRGSSADRALAVVVTVWGFICIAALIRYYRGVILIPYLTPITWIVATAVEAVAAFLIIQERRQLQKIERLEALTQRQEVLTARQEAVTKHLENQTETES